MTARTGESTFGRLDNAVDGRIFRSGDSIDFVDAAVKRICTAIFAQEI